ncbi:hypothetical protein A0H81_11984 [Grifola frondosa]|uniref:AB hydrolase-1 domain-containing protein n=1 Tax=Grifola frondosa TaxID=5627 RepID=A0A1C7LU73_GRIFR|nr:hypothetical protein A0H81_11984 [Grifola frondosa]
MAPSSFEIAQPIPKAHQGLNTSVSSRTAHDPHQLPTFSRVTSPILYLPPLLSSLPRGYAHRPPPSSPPSSFRPLTTDSHLPSIDPASLSLHRALHKFRHVTSDYATVPYTTAFNWSELELPANEEREWYCVVFRSKRREGSNGGPLYDADKNAHEEAVQNGGLILYWYGTPHPTTGLNLATCIWQSRAHAAAANARPHHVRAMRLAASSYERYELERYRLSKVRGETGVHVEPYDGGSVFVIHAILIKHASWLGKACFPNKIDRLIVNRPIMDLFILAIMSGFAPVDDKGTVLFYEDSGAPAGSTTYTTIVFVHGNLFHGAVFRRLAQYAASHNLRLVFLNLRDFPGSTPYTPAEVEAIRSPSRKTQDDTLRACGLEIAAFMSWFIETENLPPIAEPSDACSDGALTGGIALLGWSSGTCITMPVLAHADKMSDDMRKLFDAHFRSFILYDPSIISTGSTLSGKLYTPLEDESLTFQERMDKFSVYVSSYYHPLRDLFNNLSQSPSFHPDLNVDPNYIPTVGRMSPEDLRSMTDRDAVARSQSLFRYIDAQVYEENMRRALFDCHFDDGSGISKAIWPALQVRVVSCDMSTPSCVLAASILEKEYRALDDSPDKLTRRRPLHVHRLEGANHFVHWDEPERFVKLLAGIV